MNRQRTKEVTVGLVIVDITKERNVEPSKINTFSKDLTFVPMWLLYQKVQKNFSYNVPKTYQHIQMSEKKKCKLRTNLEKR